MEVYSTWFFPHMLPFESLGGIGIDSLSMTEQTVLKNYHCDEMFFRESPDIFNS